MKQVKWSRRRFLGGIAGIFLTACTQNIPPVPPMTTTNNDVYDGLNAGIHQQTHTDSNGGLLRYTIAIPDNYDNTQPTPLILALHYGGTVTPFYSTPFLEDIEPSLRNLGAITIAPDATAGQWANQRAETAIFTLLDHIEATYNIDKTRTLITGYSMGGIGTWYIAGKNQDYFKAAIPMAGRPQPNATTTDWHIPIYAIHGRQDNIIPLQPTQTTVATLQAQGVDITLVILDTANHYDTNSINTALQEATSWVQQKWEE